MAGDGRIDGQGKGIVRTNVSTEKVILTNEQTKKIPNSILEEALKEENNNKSGAETSPNILVQFGAKTVEVSKDICNKIVEFVNDSSKTEAKPAASKTTGFPGEAKFSDIKTVLNGGEIEDKELQAKIIEAARNADAKVDVSAGSQTQKEIDAAKLANKLYGQIWVPKLNSKDPIEETLKEINKDNVAYVIEAKPQLIGSIYSVWGVNGDLNEPDGLYMVMDKVYKPLKEKADELGIDLYSMFDFNTVSKIENYKRADYTSINSPEGKLTIDELKEVILKLSKAIVAKENEAS